MTGGEPSREAGFALMDALIAVALLAGTVSLVPAMVVQARQMVVKSEERFSASLAAETALTELFLLPPEQGFRRGETAGHRWQATTRQVAAPSADMPAMQSVRLVVEAGGRQVVVERLFLGGDR